jgi:nucleotide-binding universal stress UspA family protein
MVDRILVPVDGSEHAATALEYVVENFPDATVVLLHVINPAEAGYGAEAALPTVSEEWYQERQHDAEELLDELTANSHDAGIKTVEQEIEVGRPTQVIVDYADDSGTDQIVMGSHGRSGVERLLLGSVAETVMRRATVPVTVVR